jgi:hypothetical protein
MMESIQLAQMLADLTDLNVAVRHKQLLHSTRLPTTAWPAGIQQADP